MADLYMPIPAHQPDKPRSTLSESEDAELRRLHYMSKAGLLSARSRQRLADLRVRDRRQSIRNPKEFKTEDRPPRKKSIWARLFRRGPSDS